MNLPTSAQVLPSVFAANPLPSAVFPLADPFVQTAYFLDPNWKNAYSIQWNFGVQRQVTNNTVLNVNYVGSGSHRTDVGGRYGTSSVGFQPANEPDGSRRRQAIFHGVYVGTGLNWEKPFGATTLFAGVRAEWSYNWLNLLPPNNSDISDVNLLMNFGVRF